ncbi:MAG: M28 family metallopeptidase [Gemmatimonadota bacterium]
MTLPLPPARFRPLSFPVALLAFVGVAFLGACAQATRSQPAGSASQPAPRPPGEATAAGPTSPELTRADLRARMAIVAADSMMGREAGTLGNVMATDYIAAEARRTGLEPAGEDGTFFQEVPIKSRALDPAASLTVDGRALAPGEDYVPVPPGSLFPFGLSLTGESLPTIYGGRIGDMAVPLTPQQVRGKLVVLSPHVVGGRPAFQFWTQPGFERFAGAAGIAIATLDVSPPELVGFFRQPEEGLMDPADDRTGIPLVMIVSADAAAALLGAAPETLQPGATGRPVRADIEYVDTSTEHPARNVVAVLPGSDPALRGQYVAIGAHNDHVGFETSMEHDSLRAYDLVLRREGVQSAVVEPTPEQARQAQAILDSLRAERPARVDSIANGADDDGSGIVALLEIAEAFARGEERPRRSILFVWHTGEELGLLGSQWFTDHPTVPLDSIVAQLNVDMIGRGTAADLEGGGPGYVQLIGSRRLSTELGDLVETVNQEQGGALRFDYQFDADGHPQNYYCRSDHYMYARYGIPIVFFSTGSHPDYHMVTDEAQYIDFAQLERVAGFIGDVALAVANLDRRPVVDKPKPDPDAPCQQ